MKKFIQNIILGLMVALGTVSVSMAALPVAATTAFTDLQTDALALVDLAWTALIPITIAFIILRLFKRAASTAT